MLSVTLAAVTALTLAACGTETPESGFDNPLPWGAYEKLEYDVAVYDTSKNASEDKRVKIAGGEMSFVLDGSGADGTSFDMDFSVTYDDNADIAGKDAGCTDTIASRTAFEPKSLNTSYMEKTVTLADREGAANNSYRITADYFGTRKAALTYTAAENPTTKTMSLPKDPRHDNEIMFFVARAQNVKNGSSTYFKIVNIFDSFLTGEIAEYGISVGGTSKRNVDVGEWVKDFGIEAVTDKDTQEVSYPVSCVNTSLGINGDNHGPAYYVSYSLVPFKKNDEEHKKIPVRIEYSQYHGSKNYRHTVYTLKSCSFEKATAGTQE